MKKTVLGMAAGIIFLAAAGLLLMKRNAGAPLLPPGGILNSPSPAPTGNAPASPSAPSAGNTEADSEAKPSLPSTDGVSPPLLRFFQEESKSLDSVHVNAAQAEAKGEAQAKAMGSREIRYAQELVLSPHAPANQRILAIYLLTKGSAATNPALKNIATAPSYSDRAEPHTMAEHKNVEGKTFSLEATEELFHRASKNDLGALEELRKVAAEAQDLTIKNYANKKLAELSHR